MEGRKSMTLKKGFKKIVSFALAGAMALGLAVTGRGRKEPAG